METQSFSLAGLNRVIDQMIGPPPTIDGVSAEQAAESVDLKVAYSPIVMESWDPVKNGLRIPEPVKVVKDGLRYAAVWPDRHDFDWLTDQQLRVCRARFLMMKGHFYKQIRGYSHSDQQRILAWYFGGQMWQPKAGSELADALGII